MRYDAMNSEREILQRLLEFKTIKISDTLKVYRDSEGHCYAIVNGETNSITDAEYDKLVSTSSKTLPIFTKQVINGYKRSLDNIEDDYIPERLVDTDKEFNKITCYDSALNNILYLSIVKKTSCKLRFGCCNNKPLSDPNKITHVWVTDDTKVYETGIHPNLTKYRYTLHSIDIPKDGTVSSIKGLLYEDLDGWNLN